jgi:hypothetical protein
MGRFFENASATCVAQQSLVFNPVCHLLRHLAGRFAMQTDGSAHPVRVGAFRPWR